MSTLASESTAPELVAPRSGHRSAWWFGMTCLVVSTTAGLLAGFAPLGFSIAIVFLFAGPHNWMEARYFIGRMPARWGKLGSFFATGLVGAVGLATTFIAMTFVGGAWTRDQWSLAIALWNSALVLWILTLTQLRARTRPHRQWSWIVPVACLFIAATWLAPRGWSLALVYIHPLIALWYLDREIARLRPGWRPIYHASLLVSVGVLLVIWRNLASAPHLPGEDALALQITNHAGASLVENVSSHCLVATHTFLEMLHYGVWLVALPLLGMQQRPWKITSVPLARASRRWTVVLAAVLAVGGLAVLGFWCGFLANYPLTRDVYFTVAIFHVLAEVPFLLRSL